MTIDRFFYLTLTVLDQNIQDCQNMFNKIVNDGFVDKFRVNKGRIDTNRVCIGGPLYNGPVRFLIWEPKYLPGKTSFFSNVRDGYDSLIYRICKRNALSAMSVKFTNIKYTKDDLPAFFFQYYDYSKNKSIERVVYAIKETHRWVFYQDGEVQPFEDITNYENKIKPKRINKAVILDYLNRLDINIEDDNFWDSKDGLGIYFEQI